MKNKNLSIVIVISLILISAFWRVVSAKLGLYNIVPIAAIGLFSGSVLEQKKWAYLIPLSTMFLSDILFSAFTNTAGFYGISQFVNYVALVLVTFLGTFLNNRTVSNVFGYTLGGTLLFFMVSNFGTFLSGYYGYSFGGLVECYAMAIPFYKSELANQFLTNALIGDLMFSIVAFGSFALFTKRQFAWQKA